MEQWRDLPGYNGRYQASDQGRVRNRHGRILSAAHRANRNGKIGAWGYTLTHPVTGPRTMSIGQAVALSWLPNPNGYRVIRYLNRNCKDARPENLQWVETSGKGLFRTRNDSRIILKLDAYNKIQGVYYSVAETARMNDCKDQDVHGALKQNTRLYQHRYFYADEYLPALHTVAVAFRDEFY